MVLKIFLITIVFLALAFAGFAIKMFVKKGGEFKKQCSSINPETGEKYGCMCESEGESTCHNTSKELPHNIEVDLLESK